jgi:hypothetical protein
MKSMLHEASSVAKAIEKAWAESGKPREFTINVLELGVKNFLGFSKLPAIVSITFDPKSVPLVRGEQNHRPDARLQQKHRNAPQAKDDTRKRDQRDRTDRNERSDKDRQERQPQQKMRTEQQQPKPQRQQQPAQEPKARDAQREQGREREFEELVAWTPELTADLHVEAADLVKAIGITVPYAITTDKRTAHLAFAQAILPLAEEERQLFMSMSYLLIQFLKKKHKKKLRGFHVTVTTNRHDAPQQTPADS